MADSRKKIYCGCLFLITLLLSGLTPLTAAAQQLEYPDLPGLPAPDFDQGPSPFLAYLYRIFMAAGAGAAIVIIIYAGLSYLTAYDNKDRLKNAKQQLTSAVLGLVILFSSYIILSAIDPYFTLLPDLKPIQLATPPQSEEVDLPDRIPRGVEQITSLQPDTYALADFLVDQIVDWQNLFILLQIRSLVNDAKTMTQRTCPDTAAFCVPKGLAPVPVDCRWQDEEAPQRVMDKIAATSLEELTEKIKTIIASSEFDKLAGTFARINDCMADRAALMYEDSAARAAHYITDTWSRDALYFYCLTDFSAEIE